MMPTVRYIKNDFPDAMEITNDGETRRYVPEKTASIVKVPRQSHVALGHYECGGCGTTINVSDHYCRSCGAKLTKGDNL